MMKAEGTDGTTRQSLFIASPAKTTRLLLNYVEESLFSWYIINTENNRE